MTTARPLTQCHHGKVLPSGPSIAGCDGHVALKCGTSQATRLIRNAFSRVWHGVFAHHCTTRQLERVKLRGPGGSMVSQADVGYIHSVCSWQTQVFSDLVHESAANKKQLMFPTY